MKKLREYFEKNANTQQSLADALGVSRPYISLLAAGKKTPSLRVALRIEVETRGAVPAQSWVAQPKAPIETE